jgi:Dr1-associated corepressor
MDGIFVFSSMEEREIKKEAKPGEKPFLCKKKVKCRFPIARIKKIMQFDEEIGKVSTSAPIVISHALELFLTEILEILVKEATKRNAKKIVLADVNACFTENSRFDFLKGLLARESEQKR